MTKKTKNEELLEAFSDPKVAQALNAALMPSIGQCIRELQINAVYSGTPQ